MKKRLCKQIEDRQRELRRSKGQIDRAIMADLRRSYYSVAELLLSKAGAHMVICIHNALEDGDAVTADKVAHFAELVSKSLPVELHRKWGLRWKNETKLALQSDSYLPRAIPLKEWGLI